ncbi:hypothetical protein LCGC14_3126740, partial [marine sediment metagenome]
VWDASTLTWSTISIEASTPMTIGQGFWIWMYEDQVLIPPIPGDE